eukprot:TRINITY_DN108781_c0_g1_i1.p1 TRINITY_DN108781_c0_g1~~TRINITY_DN108781_c0_g1_i1.p1  ORF type:complete len:380 (-),score=61.58 TRINITY_DN108781_c0_g1_i1:88-1227(-)
MSEHAKNAVLKIDVFLAVPGTQLGQLSLQADEPLAVLLHAVAELLGSSSGVSGLRLLHKGASLTREAHKSLTAAGLSDGSAVEVIRHTSVLAASASLDGTARLWNTKSGACELVLHGHVAAVTCVAVSPDSETVATSSHDFLVKLWSTQSGACLRDLVGHEGHVLSVSFSADGAWLVSTSSDAMALLWTVSSAPREVLLAGHRDVVTHASFDPAGMAVATASRDRTARLWRDGHEALRLTHGGEVRSVAWSLDSSMLLTACSDLSAKVWSCCDGNCLLNFLGHTGALTCALFSPDDRLVLTASEDRTVRFWDLSGNQIKRFEVAEPVCSADFSPDGLLFITAGGDNAAIREVDSLRCVLELKGHQGPICSAAFSQDRKG